MNNQQPPKWAPNAIPTTGGWADPKTGEILVSVKGLANAQPRPSRRSVITTVEPVESPTLEIDNTEVELDTTFIELETTPAPVETPTDATPVVQPKRSRGRPKKTA
jgi:hypothetical protein